MPLVERERLMLSRFLDGECPPREAAEASGLLDRSPEARDYVASLFVIEDALAPVPRSEPARRRKLPWLAAAAVLLAAAVGLAVLLFSGGDEQGLEVPESPRARIPDVSPTPVELDVAGTVSQMTGPAEIRRGEEILEAKPGTEVARGDRLIVPGSAFLEIDLTGGLRLSLAPGTECRIPGSGRRVDLLAGAMRFHLDDAPAEWEFATPSTGTLLRASKNAHGYLVLSPPRESPGPSLAVHLARGELETVGAADDVALSAPVSRQIRFRDAGSEERAVTLEWGAGGLGGRIDEKLFLVEIREPGEDLVERYQLLTWPRFAAETRLALADLIEQGRLLRELPPLDRGLLSGMRGNGLLDDPLTVAARSERVERFRRHPRPKRPARTVLVHRVKLDEKTLAALVGAPVVFPPKFRGKVFLLGEKRTIAPEALLIAISKWLHLGVQFGPDGYSLVQK